ncbi:MAG TPA: thiamine-phosphate kinase [Xanthobacteraceae bacterium]|jgi:thiamine-monophosphate kinase|nr:thiamine-phosphate kinase [Xanthobacteraceae bacterium]
MSAGKPVQGSGEDHLIAHYFKPLAKHPGALGLADDTACFTPPQGFDLVLKTDPIIAGVHFFPDDAADAVARKALRVNLSDLAAKGAQPAGFLLAIALPSNIGADWLEAFARGLGEDADHFNCPLLGGDTDRTPGPLTISITVFGLVPSNTMIKRSGASAGDRIFVSGTLGDAALGLKLRLQPDLGQKFALDRKQREHLLNRYQVPEPRNALADDIRACASASMDISDGLAGDFTKLCRASGVTAEIDAARVPLSDAARVMVGRDAALIEAVLTGGDDYEILCTVPPKNVDAFRAAAAVRGIPVTEIGQISAGDQAPRFRGASGTPLIFEKPSYSHF